MKVIVISSFDCPSCIIMNDVIDKIKEKYVIDFIELDYNVDDIKKYNPGKIMPVLIFTKNDVEVYRLCGVHDYYEVLNVIEGGYSEKKF